MSNPAKSAFSRVFLIEGRARPDHVPTYESCLKAGPIGQGFGDVTRIECPDPDSYGKFVEVGSIQGAEERPSTNVVGRYPVNEESTLLRLAKARCPNDVQVHFGTCTNPSVFNEFQKVVVYEGVTITNYSTDDLGAMSSDENAAINETGDLSAEEVYEVLPVVYSAKAADTVTNEVVDVVICGSAACEGDCGDASDGCEHIYAITKAAGGSPSTPADIVFSLDKGLTWYAHDIDSLLAAEDPDGVACLGDYVVVVSNDSNSLEYVDIDELDGTTDPDWTEIATGFVALKEPNDIWSTGTKAYIVGDGGYVYLCTDPTLGVSVLDAGVAANADDLLKVHAISSTFAVAVGKSGAVIYTNDGVNFVAAARPTGAGIDLTALWVKSEDVWLVGTSTGRLYYTLDGGATWTEKAFSGSGAGKVWDISFSSDSVGWMSHSTAVPAGRIFRTYDGGNSWIITPEGAANIPANDHITAIATCLEDKNFIAAGGLGDNGADGILITGQD